MMRTTSMALMSTALLYGCAQAQAPVAIPPAVQARAAVQAPPAPAIADAEPDVAQQVSALLGQVGQGTLLEGRFTDSARAALTAPVVQQMADALRPCGAAPRLELLQRTTKGEDRNYLYRALCPNGPLLVEIIFNKAARVNRLVVKPEPR